MDLWHLRNIDWLSTLSEASLESLRAAATSLVLQRGEMIFEPVRAPQYVFLLESGRVRIFRRSAHGAEMTLGYVHPGEIFGELAVFTDKPRESYAVAAEPSTVIKIDREAFARVIRERASVVASVAKQIGNRFKQIESRAEDLVFRSARSRIAKIILLLAAEFGESDAEPPVIRGRMTQAELATLAGTSRPTVSIVLAELEQEGRIARRNGCIAIVDRAALQQDADTLG
jgi:CRP-like cAMP-binding protein